MNHSEIRKFLKSLFFQYLGFESKNFFLQFLVDIFSLESGSVDPHIFADPDPGSQNLADPTDPDPYPTHWKLLLKKCEFGNCHHLLTFG